MRTGILRCRIEHEDIIDSDAILDFIAHKARVEIADKAFETITDGRRYTIEIRHLDGRDSTENIQYIVAMVVLRNPEDCEIGEHCELTLTGPAPNEYRLYHTAELVPFDNLTNENIFHHKTFILRTLDGFKFLERTM